jgi:hypothetical protein
MNVGSELGDLLTFLAIVCVPLAVGAVLIPVGRAMAERIRGTQREPDRDDAILSTLGRIDQRLASLERTMQEELRAATLRAAQPHLPDRPASARSAIAASAPPPSITPH